MTSGNSFSLEKKFKISSADTDMMSRIRLGSYVNLLIQTAVNHADDLGIGFKSLKEQKLFWVLSRLDLKINRPLLWNEAVTVETWPKCIHKLFYIRDFIVRDSFGEVVATATSAWLSVDLDTKRPKHIDGVQAKWFTRNENRHAIQELPTALCGPVESEEFLIKTSFFDIDLNRHVTATRYIDWMMDSIDPEFLMENYPNELSINYLKETHLGDNVKLLKEQAGGDAFIFEGINESIQKTAYRGQISF